MTDLERMALYATLRAANGVVNVFTADTVRMNDVERMALSDLQNALAALKSVGSLLTFEPPME